MSFRIFVGVWEGEVLESLSLSKRQKKKKKRRTGSRLKDLLYKLFLIFCEKVVARVG